MSAAKGAGAKPGTLLPGQAVTAAQDGSQAGPAPEQANQKFVYRAGRGTPADVGQACEYFVAADLLSRGLPVTKPLNVNGPHDLHVKCGSSWITVQVKAAEVNKKTGRFRANNSHRRDCPVTSDVLAAVDLVGRRIRYTARNIPELPEELRDANS